MSIFLYANIIASLNDCACTLMQWIVLMINSNLLTMGMIINYRFQDDLKFNQVFEYFIDSDYEYYIKMMNHPCKILKICLSKV